MSGFIPLVFYFIVSMQEPSPFERAYHAQHWKMGDQGLVSMLITDINQDRVGYMWIATLSGLQRFDGWRFETFGKDLAGSDPLPTNGITKIFKAKDDTFWLGSFDAGLFSMDPVTFKVRQYAHNPEDSSTLSNDRVIGIAQDKKGDLWIGTLSGLNHFNPRSGKFKRYFYRSPLEKTDGYSGIQAVFLAENDQIFLATNYDAATFDPETKQFKRIPVIGDTNQQLVRVRASNFDEDSSGSIWFSSYNKGILKLQQGQAEFNRSISGPSGSFFDLHWDTEGRLWSGGFLGGLSLYDHSTGETSKPLSTLDKATTLANRSVRVIFEDANATLWLGTENNGVYRFNPKTLAFNHFQKKQAGNQEPQSVIRSVARSSRGGAWLGTPQGEIFSFQYQSGQVNASKVMEQVPGRIEALLDDGKGSLWASVWRKGLLRMTIATGEVTRYFPDDQADSLIQTKTIYALESDRAGTIYLGTPSGLVVFNPTNGTLFSPSAEQMHQTQSNPTVYSLFFDKQNRLWLGGGNGHVSVLDQALDYLKTLRISEKNSLDNFDHRIRALSQAADGAIYASILGDGLKRIDPNTWDVQPIDQAPETIVAMVVDPQGKLWASTAEEGLFRFDEDAASFQRFSADNGLQSLEFSNRAACLTQQGSLVFAGLNGINVFRSDTVGLSEMPPAIDFRDVLVHGKRVSNRENELPIKEQQSLNAKVMRLESTQNTITFHFLALKTEQPQKVRLQQRLEPLDVAWQNLPSYQKEMTFYNLGPGTYRYSLRAANADGVWMPQPETIQFLIAQPFWKTPLALASYLILLFLVGWFWIRYRTASLAKQAQALETKVQLRTAEIETQKNTIETLLERQKLLFAHISHEFRTPLTLILGPLDQLNRKKPTQPNKSFAIIRNNAMKLLRMVDQILDLTRLGNKTQSIRTPLELSKQLKSLLPPFEALFKERNLELIKQFESNVWVSLNPDAFEKMMLNLLSNALKYSPAGGRVKVLLETSHRQAIIKVEDSGRGIETKDLDKIFERFYRCEDSELSRIPGTGMGLALVKALVHANLGTISVRSQVGKGSVFTMTFPLCEPGENGDDTVLAEPQIIDSFELETNSMVEVPIPKSNTEGIGANKAVVLVVEDNPAMSDYIISELTSHYQCVTAFDGHTGLTMARDLSPDMIISDVMMPGLDGFALNQAIKTDPATSHIPVILLTAKGDRDSFMQGLQQGADAYMTKPFDALELKYRIDNLLSIRELFKKRFGGQLFANQADTVSDEGMNAVDQAFLQQFKELLATQFQDPEFGLSEMVAAMAMSERPLQRKLKALTDHTPSQFLRKYRLGKAASLISAGGKSSEVAFKVGFSSHSYFSSCFKAQFGVSPSQYGQQPSAK